MITVVHDQALCCLVASVAGWQLVVLMKFQLELHGDLGICSHWIVIWISRIGSIFLIGKMTTLSLTLKMRKKSLTPMPNSLGL